MPESPAKGFGSAKGPGELMKSLPRGRVYMWLPDSASLLGGRVATSVVPLFRLDTQVKRRSRLSGRHVRVRNGGEIYEPTNSGVRSKAIGAAQPNARGDFLFEPGRGGGRVDKVVFDGSSSRLAEYLESGVPFPEPEFRDRYVQASHFGEVNTYFHIDLIATYVHDLLRELGAPRLPRVVAVVNAHHAVTEKNGVRDGLWRINRWLPFQGGHYRLPARRYDLYEYAPISTDGEIHLGTGRNLLQCGALVEAAGGPYRANASHNAGIIYHEYGHHITRHTADYRANALRPRDQQNNRKVALDEGTCDYWAATMLGTPHIWAWHLRHDEQVTHSRSLSSSKTMADFDASPRADAHANGTIWGAALWDLRTRLGRIETEGVRRTDILVLKGLLLIGGLPKADSDADIRAVCRIRKSFAVGLATLLWADELLNSSRYREIILSTFSERGIQPMADEEWRSKTDLEELAAKPERHGHTLRLNR
jgi:hypothetical protein